MKQSFPYLSGYLLQILEYFFKLSYVDIIKAYKVRALFLGRPLQSFVTIFDSVSSRDDRVFFDKVSGRNS